MKRIALTKTAHFVAKLVRVSAEPPKRPKLLTSFATKGLTALSARVPHGLQMT